MVILYHDHQAACDSESGGSSGDEGAHDDGGAGWNGGSSDLGVTRVCAGEKNEDRVRAAQGKSDKTSTSASTTGTSASAKLLSRSSSGLTSGGARVLTTVAAAKNVAQKLKKCEHTSANAVNAVFCMKNT